MSYELESLRLRSASRMEELCSYLLPVGRKNGSRWICGSIQGEKGDSFSVNLSTGVFGDYAVDDKMSHGAINLWMAVRDVDFKTACRELSAWLGSANPIREERPYAAAKPKAKEPCLFPELRTPTLAEINELSMRRHVRFLAVRMAVDSGFLWMFDHPKNGVCWLWTDQRRMCGIRRRLDGGLFITSSGATKSAACPHSIMNEPLGYIEAATNSSFAVVEGAPDGLAVYDQSIAIGGTANVAPIVMPCTQARFTDASLSALKGKKGQIFMDNDEAGKKASLAWFNQLSTAGIAVSLFNFANLFTTNGDPVKDLNDYCRIPKRMGCHPMAFAVDREIAR